MVYYAFKNLCISLKQPRKLDTAMNCLAMRKVLCSVQGFVLFPDTEWSEQVWTGVTGISLCSADAPSASARMDNVGSRWYNHTYFPNYFINCRTYQLYWRRSWNSPPSLSIYFWHLFIQFRITHCSSPFLISSRILRFSASRVHGFVFYTEFLNLAQR